MGIKIYLLYCTIAAGLTAVFGQKPNCEVYQSLNETKCLPFGPPNCTNITDPLLECAETVESLVEQCEVLDKQIVVVGQMHSVKLMREVICDDKDIQYAFRRRSCWKKVGNCTMASLYVPLEFEDHNRTFESEVCQHEMLQLEECSSQIEETCGSEATTPSLNFVDRLLKKSKCSGQITIKMAANFLLLTLIALILTW